MPRIKSKNEINEKMCYFLRQHYLYQYPSHLQIVTKKQSRLRSDNFLNPS